MATAGSTMFKLSNGVEIPALGFGCAFGNWTNALTGGTAFEGFCPEEAWAPITKAVQAGYTHFDGALIYGTSRVLGTVLGMKYADGTLKRSDMFITSKVFHMPAGIALNTQGHTMDMTNPAVNVPERVTFDYEKVLADLGHGYCDLLLMHWPGVGDDALLNRSLRKQCWTAMEGLYKAGRVRAIGVSNFRKKHLEQLIADTTIVPMVNQIEVSPYITNAETVNFCKEKGILVEAWAPFGSGATGVLKDPLFAELGAKYGKGGGQIILRWLVQQGIVALPKSSSLERMKENLDIFNFEISDEDMTKISALNRNASSVPHASPDDIA
jgi:diketogulonate reductase-like aldo/keto reductase